MAVFFVLDVGQPFSISGNRGGMNIATGGEGIDGHLHERGRRLLMSRGGAQVHDEGDHADERNDDRSDLGYQGPAG